MDLAGRKRVYPEQLLSRWPSQLPCAQNLIVLDIDYEGVWTGHRRMKDQDVEALETQWIEGWQRRLPSLQRIYLNHTYSESIEQVRYDAEEFEDEEGLEIGEEDDRQPNWMPPWQGPLFRGRRTLRKKISGCWMITQRGAQVQWKDDLDGTEEGDASRANEEVKHFIL